MNLFKVANRLKIKLAQPWRGRQYEATPEELGEYFAALIDENLIDSLTGKRCGDRPAPNVVRVVVCGLDGSQKSTLGDQIQSVFADAGYHESQLAQMADKLSEVIMAEAGPWSANLYEELKRSPEYRKSQSHEWLHAKMFQNLQVETGGWLWDAQSAAAR